MKHSRPSRHLRRVHTKRGVKKIMINPTIHKRRRNYGALPTQEFEHGIRPDVPVKEDILFDGKKVGEAHILRLDYDHDHKPYYIIRGLEIDEPMRRKNIGTNYVKGTFDRFGKENVTAIARKDSLGFWERFEPKKKIRMPTRAEEYFLEF